MTSQTTTPDKPLTISVIVHDSFGRTGGIAKFNRDLIGAICGHPSCGVCRVIAQRGGLSPEEARSNLAFTAAAGGRLRLILAILKAALTGTRPDLLVCGHINLLPAAMVWSWIRQTPVLLILHGIDAWEPPRGRVARWCARRSYRFACVSQYTMDRFVAWSGQPVDRGFILPNCYDETQFAPGERRADLIKKHGLDDKRVVMTLARLDHASRRKGVEEMFAALPMILETEPNTVFLVAGEGADRARLEQRAESLGLSGHARFAGFVPEEEKADYYRLADAFVLAGDQEGFGIVLLEAMASGVPVVASVLDGSREAVRDGLLGELVDPYDPYDLARGVLAALKKPAGRIPPGLDHYSNAEFDHRAQAIVDAIAG